jgi:hypothetical protein
LTAIEIKVIPWKYKMSFTLTWVAMKVANYSLNGKKLLFCWGTCPTDLFGTLDVTQAYIDLGGSISINTQVNFSSTFPMSTYEKTALTNKMRKEYQCAGSLTAAIFEPGKEADYMSLSDYYDLTKHDPNFGDHHNLYLQHKIGDQKIDHTRNYFEEKDRHIKLNETVYVAAFIDGKKVFEDYVKASTKK